MGSWVSNQSSVVNINEDFSLRTKEIEKQFEDLD